MNTAEAVSKIETVVAWAQDAACAYPFPRALYSFHNSWLPAVDAAIVAGRLTPCMPGIAGEMAMIGYWIPEAMAKRLDHEIYDAMKWHRLDGNRDGRDDRHTARAVEFLFALVDLAAKYDC